MGLAVLAFVSAGLPLSAWAVAVDITIQNGTFPNFSATYIHKNPYAGGSPLYKPLTGTLWGDLDQNTAGYYELTGINGTLKDDTGNYTATLEILSGSITSGPGNAFGQFNYKLNSLTGPYVFNNVMGTFTFDAGQTANFLRMDALDMYTLQLWGGDPSAQYQKCRSWGCYNKTGIGLDFRAKITPKTDTTTNVPEPATLALFGTGLAGIGLLRYRKSRREK